MFISGKHVSIDATESGLNIHSRNSGESFKLNQRETEEFVVIMEMIKAGAQLHVHVGRHEPEPESEPLPAAGYN